MFAYYAACRNWRNIERLPYQSSDSQFGVLHHHLPSGFKCILTEIPPHLAANLSPNVQASDQLMYRPVKLGAGEAKLKPALKVWINLKPEISNNNFQSCTIHKHMHILFGFVAACKGCAVYLNAVCKASSCTCCTCSCCGASAGREVSLCEACRLMIL